MSIERIVTELSVGDSIVAVSRIVEDGVSEGLEGARFPEYDYIHAEPGEAGFVVGVDDGVATVRFHRTGTATAVADNEVVLAS